MQEIYYNVVMPIIGIIGLYLFICLIIVILDLIIKLPLHRLDKYRIKKKYSEYNPEYFIVYVQKLNLMFRNYYTVEKGIGSGFVHASVEHAEKWIKTEKERNEAYYQRQKSKKNCEYFYIKE